MMTALRSTWLRDGLCALAPAALLVVGSAALAASAENPPADPPPVIAAPPDAPAAEPAPAPAAGTTAPKLPTPAETLGAIGRFIDQSVSKVGAGIDAGVKGAGETIGGATSAAGEIAKGVTDAAGSAVTLPLGNVVSGRQPCLAAANQTPDCTVASVLLCRSKGFTRGTAIDITTARKCPAQVYLQGASEAACTSEAFVARASCQ
jgi:hypothetical protein